MGAGTLIIRNAEIDGVGGRDVRIRDGQIAEVGVRLSGGGLELDAKGGALICGLIDHHIHLLATAALADSLTVETIEGPAAFAMRLRQRLSERTPGAWLRVTGYHERIAGPLGRAELDVLAPDHPVRVQHQTGSLWMLNSRALAIIARDELPPCVERDADGAPAGRIWRGDAWLERRIGRTTPPLAPIGAALAACGVTGVMDASASTDAGRAETLAQAVRAGDLPQRLRLMSAGMLQAIADGAFVVGPVKILLDDHDLPPLDDFVGRIELARQSGRSVAVHCVTAAELALTLAAFQTAGSRPGDRVEHGGLIAADAIAVLRQLGLTVVTQPGFVFERGERYLTEVDPGEHADLYRCGSLLAAGVPVAASSDAPYSSTDPWSAMRAAVRRQTKAGHEIGPFERISPRAALGLFLGDFDAPGGPRRHVVSGVAADLCLLKTPLCDGLDAMTAELVAVTLIDGRVVYESG